MIFDICECGLVETGIGAGSEDLLTVASRAIQKTMEESPDDLRYTIPPLLCVSSCLRFSLMALCGASQGQA